MPAQTPKQHADETPTLIIVMGVSGSGKSTLAARLAQHYQFTFIEADEYHSEEAKRKMHKGVPLDDADRAPWIARLCACLQDYRSKGRSCVLAYSGLRHKQREHILNQGFHTATVFLQGSEALIAKRLAGRKNHFMSPQLLHSQFDSLQAPKPEEGVITLNVTPSPETLFQQSIEALERYLGISAFNH